MPLPFRLTLALALTLTSLAGCKLVKNVDEAGEGSAAGGSSTAPANDMDAQVAAMWDDQVMAHFNDAATDLATLLPAIESDIEAAGEEYAYRPAGSGGAWNFTTQFTGTIVAADTETRAATADVDIDGDGAGDATVQLGPVLRGTALRDALPFIDFTSFGDQIAFAQLSRSLNTRAYDGALAPLDRDDLEGRQVRVTGAFALSQAGGEILVTPVALEEIAP
ncbi:DUF2291 family protein [Pararhizobium haloflavum]|uniref:DUF2291 family protein n=1 Tax=Pararhizobium haloflavum TaxID=2037914 RepID=UPI000C17843C|nr:DUF2291 domain-containing protein [Pararhizobium haloflavum]